MGWWQRGVEEREDGELERLSGPDLERNGQADGRGSSPRPGGAATPGRAGTMRILLHADVLLHVLRARTHTTAPSRWSVIFFREHKHGLSSQGGSFRPSFYHLMRLFAPECATAMLRGVASLFGVYFPALGDGKHHRTSLYLPVLPKSSAVWGVRYALCWSHLASGRWWEDGTGEEAEEEGSDPHCRRRQRLCLEPSAWPPLPSWGRRGPKSTAEHASYTIVPRHDAHP